MTGQTISHYRIFEKLGEGGMGVVYKAEDTKLRRKVALKFLPQHAEENRERFLREAQAAASLNHPNLCTIFEIAEEHGFIAMEFVEGPSVKDKITARPLPLDEALDIATQACTGLQAAHEKGIVHRDIKPANLMLTAQGQVKIMDFGLAQISDRTRLTKPGASMGTAAYMSPEQTQGQPTDRCTDIWSIGVVLYEMLAGAVPFPGQTDAACTYSIVHTEPQPLTALRSGLPLDLDRIIGKALRKDPRDRYQNAADLMVDLRHLTGQPLAATATRRASKTKIAWKLIVPAAAAVMALFAGGYFYLHRATKLTDKDTIVLADFTNTTGDPVFDGTLRQGLAIQLAQSPFLSLVSEQRIQQALRLMGQPGDARLTRERAREICERTGSAAVLDGSIASLGSQYVLGLRATNCRTGDVLDEEQAQAARKEEVLSALSQIASKFRTRVGESLASMEKHDTPLAEATTPSLEALKAYSGALKAIFTADFSAAVPLLERTVEIDSNFALAHAHLAVLYRRGRRIWGGVIPTTS